MFRGKYPLFNLGKKIYKLIDIVLQLLNIKSQNSTEAEVIFKKAIYILLDT